MTNIFFQPRDLFLAVNLFLEKIRKFGYLSKTNFNIEEKLVQSTLHGLMVLTPPIVFAQTDGIESVLLNHTRTRGPSVTRRRDFLIV